MLEEDGVVVSVSNGMAEVSVTPQAACGNCTASRGCGTSLIASLFPVRRSKFKVKNSLGARAGEQVIVGLHESALQSASMMLYLTPLAGLILGAMGGNYLSGHVFHSSTELPSILFGFLGMAAGLSLVSYSIRHLRGPGRYQAEIIRIKNRENGESHGPRMTLEPLKNSE